MEDKKISDISKLLIRGAKMLSYHCPDCSIPLFQEGDRIFCPSCNRDVIIEKSESKKDIEGVTSKKQIYPESGLETDKQEIDAGEVRKPGLSDIDVSFKNVIVKLSKSLDDAKDLNEIKEIVETIDRIVDLLERIKRNLS